jgi:hypothetical protein
MAGEGNRAKPRFEDHEVGFSWMPDPRELMKRACHAVRLGPDGDVWIIDPVDVPGLDERIAALAGGGEKTAGVLQLLDRHERDCEVIAERHGAPLHRLPFDGIEETKLEMVSVVRNPFWKEVAIWSEIDRTLIVAESVGTAPYFRAGDERLGIHPMMRLRPPHDLEPYEPEHPLTGHGTGLHGPGTAEALAEAIAAARRRIPRAVASMIRRR